MRAVRFLQLLSGYCHLLRWVSVSIQPIPMKLPVLLTAVGLAAVTLEGGEATRALTLLDALPADRVAAYQPYWVTRARVLRGLGRDAGPSLTQALALTEDPALRHHLQTQG